MGETGYYKGYQVSLSGGSVGSDLGCPGGADGDWRGAPLVTPGPPSVWCGFLVRLVAEGDAAGVVNESAVVEGGVGS